MWSLKTFNSSHFNYNNRLPIEHFKKINNEDRVGWWSLENRAVLLLFCNRRTENNADSLVEDLKYRHWCWDKSLSMPTRFNPTWVSAEHSKYWTALISLAIWHPKYSKLHLTCVSRLRVYKFYGDWGSIPSFVCFKDGYVKRFSHQLEGKLFTLHVCNRSKTAFMEFGLCFWIITQIKLCP